MPIFTTYKFRGKHATYAKYLSKDKGQLRKDGVNVFDRVVDVYMASAIIGLKNGAISKSDNSTNDSSDIPYQAMNTSRDDLEYIYRLVMLLDTSSGLNEKERIDRAFKTDTDDEAVKRNLALFNGYVLGGLEILYDKFVGLETNESEKMNVILDLVDDFPDESLDDLDDYDPDLDDYYDDEE